MRMPNIVVSIASSMLFPTTRDRRYQTASSQHATPCAEDIGFGSYFHLTGRCRSSERS